MLRARGARELFGIPGDFALPFIKVVEQSPILPFYALSHEPAVGFAADAAARFNCILGVANAIDGVGTRVSTRAELAAALEPATSSHGRFQLIGAMLPRKATSDTLAPYVEGFRKSASKWRRPK